MAVETIKISYLRLHRYLLFSSVAESAAVTPHRKFWFASFVERSRQFRFFFLRIVCFFFILIALSTSINLLCAVFSVR